MAFIELTDLDDVIKAEILTDVIDGSSSAFDDAAAWAQARCSGYLSARFDIADTFGKTGAARNIDVLGLMKDLLLYRLHMRINPRMVPEVRIHAYDEAMKVLGQCQSGKYCPVGLKALTDTSVDPALDESNRRMGSEGLSNKRY